MASSSRRKEKPATHLSHVTVTSPLFWSQDGCASHVRYIAAISFFYVGEEDGCVYHKLLLSFFSDDRLLSMQRGDREAGCDWLLLTAGADDGGGRSVYRLEENFC